MPETMQRLDEVEIKSHFDLDEAISSLKFYWNLAKRNNEPIWFEIWGKAQEKKLKHLPLAR